MYYTFQIEPGFLDQFADTMQGITPKDTENIAELIRKRIYQNIVNQVDVFGNPFMPLKSPNKTGKRLMDEQYLVNEIFKAPIPKGFEVFIGGVEDRDEIAIYQNFGTSTIPATNFFMDENEEIGSTAENDIETYLELKLMQLLS